MASLSALTSHGLKLAINSLVGGTVYVALHTGNPGEDAAENEVDDSLDAGYARQAVTFSPAENGRTASTNAISWTVADDSPGYTVTHLSLWDAETGGNPLFVGELVIPVALQAGDVNGALAAGSIIIKGL